MSVTPKLVFRLPPVTTGRLVFGEVEGLPPDFDTIVNATFPAMELAAIVAPRVDVTVNGAFPAMELAAIVHYDLDVARPMVGSVATSAQSARRLPISVESVSPGFEHARVATGVRHQDADPLRAATDLRLPYRFIKSRTAVAPRQTSADSLPTPALALRHQEMIRVARAGDRIRHQDGIRIQARIETDAQDRWRDRRPSLTLRSQDGVAMPLRRLLSHQSGQAIRVGRASRAQDAMRPPPGVTVIVPPEPERCYTPSPRLVFSAAAATGPALIFRCDEHDNPPGPGTVVVPVRRTYMILNNVSLRRLAGDIELPALSMTLALDDASWTYGFNASLPADVLPYLQPESDGSPAVLAAEVNGQTFHMLAEGIARERVFGQRTISVNGRGKNALLDAPYAPTMQFTSAEARSVQQLMQHVLSVNGVPLGWGVDFNVDDWLVPGGTWALQGSYIAALNDIAAAAGAYLQPHPTDDVLRLLKRYPSAPWEWGSVSPDFVLPASIVVQESIEWSNKPAYNAIVVAGTTADGITGNVMRAGTAGDLSAQMVTHALMTHATGARQRAIAALGDAGRQARVGLRLPVLSETGIIMPGKFVSYADGSDTRFGIVRGVDVQVAQANVWQSITVETHE